MVGLTSDLISGTDDGFSGAVVTAIIMLFLRGSAEDAGSGLISKGPQSDSPQAAGATVLLPTLPPPEERPPDPNTHRQGCLEG